MSLSNRQKNTHSGLSLPDDTARLNRIPNKNWEDTFAGVGGNQEVYIKSHCNLSAQSSQLL